MTIYERDAPDGKQQIHVTENADNVTIYLTINGEPAGSWIKSKAHFRNIRAWGDWKLVREVPAQ